MSNKCKYCDATMKAMVTLKVILTAQENLLRNLAASACDNCGERDCETCWAKEYREVKP